jgi:hypothetical protein
MVKYGFNFYMAGDILAYEKLLDCGKRYFWINQNISGVTNFVGIGKITKNKREPPFSWNLLSIGENFLKNQWINKLVHAGGSKGFKNVK